MEVVRNYLNSSWTEVSPFENFCLNFRFSHLCMFSCWSTRRDFNNITVYTTNNYYYVGLYQKLNPSWGTWELGSNWKALFCVSGARLGSSSIWNINILCNKFTVLECSKVLNKIKFFFLVYINKLTFLIREILEWYTKRKFELVPLNAPCGSIKPMLGNLITCDFIAIVD